MRSLNHSKKLNNLSRKTVVVIDEDHGLSQEFCEALRFEGFTCVEIRGVDLVRDFESLGGEKILFFAAPDDDEKRRGYDEILARHPGLPVIYLLANDCPMNEKIKTCLGRRIVRPLSSKTKLIQLTHEAFEILGRRSLVPTFDSLGLIENLDFSRSLKKLTAQLAQVAGAENCAWVKAERIQNNKIVEAIDEIQAAAIPFCDFYSEKPLETPFIGHFDLSELTDSLVVINAQAILPIKGESAEVVGYFLLFKISDELALKNWLESNGDFIQAHLKNCLRYWRVKNLNFLDDLTGLYNQRYLVDLLEREMSRAQRNKSEFTVLFMDIDYFKLVNDANGHLVGSRVLIEMAQLIHGSLRTTDSAFRYGGDEFVVILSETDCKGAEVVAERLRALVEKTCFKIGGVEVKTTVSIGVASYPQHAQNSNQILKMADQAMYYGKNKSRNVVYIAS